MNNDFPFNHFLKVDSSLEKNNEKTRINSDLKANEVEKDSQMPLFHNGFNPSQNQESSSSSENKKLTEIHKKVLNSLKDLINPQKYNAFFSDTFFLNEWCNERVTFTTTTHFIKKMIENHYLSQLRDIVFSLSSSRPLVTIEISKKDDLELRIPPTSQINDKISSFLLPAHSNSKTVKDATFRIDLIPSREDLKDQVESQVISHFNESNFGFSIDPKKTFDNFIVGPSNNMVVASAKAASKSPGKVYPTLYVHSNSGLGKTHILHSVANYIKENHPTLRICLISTTDFLNDMIDSMTKNKMPEFRRKYTDLVDILMIDDIHELKGKTQTQNEFFYVFNELHNKHKQLIFTSDRPPNEIDGLEERIKTRLSWGLVLDIQPPDLETRIAILKRKAVTQDVYISEDVINLIAGSIESNIRELEGSLIRLVAYSSIFNVDIDVEIAKEQLKLKNTISKNTKTLETIAKAVSTYLKVPVPDLRSKVRTKMVTFGRHVAMFLSYNLLGSTLHEIGLFYGNRDHTSVMHAIEKIKNQKLNDPELNNTIFEIERLISLG